MRMLLEVSANQEIFNAGVKDGSAGQKLGRILEEIKPEAVYFSAVDGKRTAYIVVNIDNASQISSIAEPFFLTFNASVKIHPVMTPEDLGNAGLDELGKKWG